jgi:ABC-2 type transport system ATP-binding protein
MLNTYFEVSDYANKQVRTLSFGQRIRGELLCALIHNPRLIILDEPTVGIDVSSKQLLHRFLTDTSFMDDKTVIITSHEPQIIRDFSTRCIELTNGLITYDGCKDGYNLGLSIELQVSLRKEVQIKAGAQYGQIVQLQQNDCEIKVAFKPGATEFDINEWISESIGLDNISTLSRNEKLYSEVA